MASSANELNQVDKYPNLYRKAVLKVFLSFIKGEGKSVGTPVKLLQEFASYTEKPYLELKDDYEKRLENIRYGVGIKNHLSNDLVLFSLIERFVWNHQKEAVSTLLLRRDVHELGCRLSEWHKVDSYYSASVHLLPYARLKSVDEGRVYKIKAIEKDKSMGLAVMKYLAFQRIEDEGYCVAIIFSKEPDQLLCYGLYLEASWTFFMRNAFSSYPCTISVIQDMSIVSKIDIDKNTNVSDPVFAISTNYSEAFSNEATYSGGGTFSHVACSEVTIPEDNARLLKSAKSFFSRYEQLIDHFGDNE
jgi:hypothetical protein